MDNVPARTDRQTGQIIHYFGSTPVSWVAAADIARVAAVVLRRPGDFADRALPLAADSRSMGEIAARFLSRMAIWKSGRHNRSRRVNRVALMFSFCAFTATRIARIGGRP